MKTTDRPRTSLEDFQRVHGSESMGVVARIVYAWYFWWMRREISAIKSKQDILMLHETPRARRFWFLCGLMLAVPVVLLLMFAWSR